ncbi:hypothetical protein CNR22_23955 [Sphingobacteriaceae bacterium]|nr:hypothetical protein CNR22_23955 [Sphingobacteriaceae bacterium]
MKMNTQILFHTVLLLAGVKSYSQTLTCTSTCPKIGEIFSIKTSSPVLHTNGKNQVWNFSQVYYLQGSTKVSYADAASIPSSSLYPLANLVCLQGNSEKFLEVSDDGILLANSTTVSVTNQSVLLPLPFSYGSIHTETLVTTSLSGLDTLKMTAIKNIQAVGTGTLILPTATYTDVLRITGTLSESQTVNGTSDGYTLNTTIHYYYSEKISHPLLYSDQRSSSGGTDYGPNTWFLSEITTGIKRENLDEQNTLVVSPNPASDFLHVTTVRYEEGQLRLFNALGDLVLSKTFSETERLDVSKLSEGFYTLCILQNGKLQSKKIVIAR